MPKRKAELERDIAELDRSDRRDPAGEPARRRRRAAGRGDVDLLALAAEECARYDDCTLDGEPVTLARRPAAAAAAGAQSPRERPAPRQAAGRASTLRRDGADARPQRHRCGRRHSRRREREQVFLPFYPARRRPQGRRARARPGAPDRPAAWRRGDGRRRAPDAAELFRHHDTDSLNAFRMRLVRRNSRLPRRGKNDRSQPRWIGRRLRKPCHAELAQGPRGGRESSALGLRGHVRAGQLRRSEDARNERHGPAGPLRQAAAADGDGARRTGAGDQRRSADRAVSRHAGGRAGRRGRTRSKPIRAISTISPPSSADQGSAPSRPPPPPTCAAYLGDLAARGFKPSSVARRLSAIRQLYRFLYAEGHRSDDPAAIIEGPKRGRPLPKVLADRRGRPPDRGRPAGRRGGRRPEPERLRARRLYCLLELLYATGLRISELVALPASAARRDERMLIVRGKGGKERLVPLNERGQGGDARLCIAARAKCGERDAGSKWLFPSFGEAGHLTRQHAAREFKAWPAAAGPARRPGQPARAAPCLCEPPAAQWRRPAGGADPARPCRHLHHPDLYPCAGRSAQEPGARSPSAGRGVERGVMRSYLDFEKPVAELEAKVEELRALAGGRQCRRHRRGDRAARSQGERRARGALCELTPWQKTQVARHPQRPHCLDYVAALITDFTPLAGDRKFGDDDAIVGGFGRFNGDSICVIGHEKGSTTESRLKHNFGMARPEGYRKAVRLMELADRFDIPGAGAGRHRRRLSGHRRRGARPGRGDRALDRRLPRARRAQRGGDPRRRRLRRRDRDRHRQPGADAASTRSTA